MSVCKLDRSFFFLSAHKAHKKFAHAQPLSLSSEVQPDRWVGDSSFTMGLLKGFLAKSLSTFPPLVPDAALVLDRLFTTRCGGAHPKRIGTMQEELQFASFAAVC